MMSVYTESKITIPEERYNELIRAEYALLVVRRFLNQKARDGEKVGELVWTTISKDELDFLLMITGKGEIAE